jgi:hypothetical protein
LYKVEKDVPETLVPDISAGSERDVSFPHGVTLAGVEAPVEVERGDVAMFTYFWRADRDLQTDLSAATLFFDEHGVAVESLGFPIWSQNRQLGQGVAPTSEWRSGELRRESYYSLTPRSLAPGLYDVRIAVFDPESPTGAVDAGQTVSVGSVVVR